MSEPSADFILEKLAALQTELVERAYELERQGRVDAADEAVTASTRVGELRAELAGAAV
jgi:hypothetical protein